MAVVDQLLVPPRRIRSFRGAAAWSRLSLTDKLALFAFAFVIIVSYLGPFFAPHGIVTPIGKPFSPPGHGALLGTDDLGRDLFSRILYGARESWNGTFIVVGVGATFGTCVGLIAGATGGWVDALLMRITDLFLALPAPLLALCVVAALGASFLHTLIAVTVVWWPLYTRLVRGEVKAIASRPHADAARLAGISRRRLWFRHLLPGAFPPVVVAISLDLGNVVLTIAGLSFLGLGSPDPAAELGAMTARGLPYLLSSAWVALYPALAVFIIALTSNFAGDAVNKLLVD